MAGPSHRVGALDAVRGIAILSVICTHSLTAVVAFTGSNNIPSVIFRAFDFAQFGVPLFFALSGWLMFSLYTGGKPFKQKVYWTRRWARIWPLWAVFTFVSYALYGTPDTLTPLGLDIVLVLLFLGWLSPILIIYPLGGYTIQQEMGHYLLFSAFRRRGPMFFAGTVIVGYLTWMVAKGALAFVGPDTFWSWAFEAWLRLGLFRSWPFFLLGGAGFVIYRMWQAKGVGEVLPRDPKVAGMVSLALFLSLFTEYAQQTPGFFVLGFVLLGAAMGIVMNEVPVLGPSLRSIGKYSYFMYFMHFIVLRWLQGLYIDSSLPAGGTTSGLYNVLALFVTAAIATAVSWCFGWVSWRVFEKPILSYAHRRVQ